MTHYVQTVLAHRRLAILRHLEASPEYVSNASILQGVLVGLGLPCSADQLLADLGWLREAALVRCDLDADFVIVTVTPRGAEVARGLAEHPGVQRPRPRR